MPFTARFTQKVRLFDASGANRTFLWLVFKINCQLYIYSISLWMQGTAVGTVCAFADSSLYKGNTNIIVNLLQLLKLIKYEYLALVLLHTTKLSTTLNVIQVLDIHTGH
jgi:hypothetical protein